MTKKKPRRYYSLLLREPTDTGWSLQFGDYDRKVVAQEGDDMKQSGSWVKGSKLKIIDTPDGQAEINAAVAELNAQIAFRQIKADGVLEDRLEYDIEMLEKMHGLNNDAATVLHRLLRYVRTAA